jgi:hypothetical protein
MVFNEQLTTGSFQGRYPIDDEIRPLMQAIKAQGRILPYYGAGGSRGSCECTLQRAGKNYTVRVENTTVKESAEFADKSICGLFQSPRPTLILKIDGQELQNLRQWEHWVERQASTSRYIYKFGQVAMGHLGYTVKVEDTQTGHMIDVTDYADW